MLLSKPGLCDVQYVLDTPLKFAKAWLVRGNCRVGKLRHAYSVNVGRGHVISQRPKFGAVLAKGGKVNLVVSKGRRR